MARTFDPFDTEQVQAAWPLLEELRREGQLAPIGEGMQYVTRHEECRDVLRDITSFSDAPTIDSSRSRGPGSLTLAIPTARSSVPALDRSGLAAHRWAQLRVECCRSPTHFWQR